MARSSSSNHPYPRSARVNQILREVISDELVRISDIDERLGFLTVTGVETSPDLRHAKVYLDSVSDVASSTIAAAPSLPDGYLWRALVETNRNSPEQAETDLKTAIRIAEDYLDQLIDNVGRSLQDVTSEGDPDQLTQRLAVALGQIAELQDRKDNE